MQEHEITGWVDRLNWLFSRVSMWLVAAIIAIMAYEVVLRYVFERPTLWANEMSLWLAGMVYLFAGLYAMQQRSHIRIFVLYDMAPRWARKTFDVISTACIVLFAMATVYGGYDEAKAKLLRWETFGTAFDPPIPATMKPLVLLTVIVLALQAISNLIYDWHKEPESHDPSDEFLTPEQRAERAAAAAAEGQLEGRMSVAEQSGERVPLAPDESPDPRAPAPGRDTER